MNADERAKAVEQATHIVAPAAHADWPPPPFRIDLARDLLALDAQLTAVEKERDETKKRASKNLDTGLVALERAVAAEKERDEWMEKARLLDIDLFEGGPCVPDGFVLNLGGAFVCTCPHGDWNQGGWGQEALEETLVAAREHYASAHPAEPNQEDDGDD